MRVKPNAGVDPPSTLPRLRLGRVLGGSNGMLGGRSELRLAVMAFYDPLYDGFHIEAEPLSVPRIEIDHEHFVPHLL